MKISIINKSKYELPDYATIGSAGVDLIANLAIPYRIYPHEQVLIPTGLFVAIPEGYELQIRSRSGLTLKHGIVVANSPGTVDSDFRGEVGVILTKINTEEDSYVINPGDKIAQMVLAKVEKIKWEVVKQLPETSRGDGGFGSTGQKTK